METKSKGSESKTFANTEAPDYFVEREFKSLRIRREMGLLGVIMPVHGFWCKDLAGDPGYVGTPFFTADNRTWEVLRFSYRFADKSGNANTMKLVKMPSGTAYTAGTSMLSAAIDMATGTANVLYTHDFRTTLYIKKDGSNILKPTDSLGILLEGNSQGLYSLHVSVLLRAM
jgi:hypothetical protein